MMILFYICFITIFFPQLSFAEQKALTLETEPDLKIVQGTSYYDGTILLRLTRKGQNINCDNQNLWFNIIETDGKSTSLNVLKHSINKDNFCSISKSSINKRSLDKRHPECEGAKSTTFECCDRYPDYCKSPDTAKQICDENPSREGCDRFCRNNPGSCSSCEVNPYGKGCNVDCGSTPRPKGCGNVPDCGKNPDATGCNDGRLDCTKFPTAPACTGNDCAKNPAAPGCSDCAKNPAAPGCSDCAKNPAAPGCSDCAKNPAAPGCNDCAKNPAAPGCSDCAKNPSAPGCSDCAKNPSAPGCSDCAKNPSAPGCSDCAKNPSAPGCSECAKNPYGPKCVGGPDCAKTPAAIGCNNIPNCNNATPNTPGCNGKLLDCSVFPRAPECRPNDCAKTPSLPGCNECDYNPEAPGCGICNENPNASRCLLGYCDKNPDTPECSLVVLDRVKVHAVTREYILVTYFCNPSVGPSSPASTDLCGSIIDWDGFEVFHFEFEKSCNSGRIIGNLNGKGFLFSCYKPDTKEIHCSTYGAPNPKGEVSVTSVRTFNDVETFSLDRTSIFVTEDGGYCILTVFSGTIFASFVPKDSSANIRDSIKLYSNSTDTGIYIYVCNIAYQSSGYSCVIRVTQGVTVTYYEMDFLSDGTFTMVPFDLSQITPGKVITEVVPLIFGGYVIILRSRTTGVVSGYVIDNKGKFHSDWGITEEFYTDEFVLTNNNTIIAIPASSSNTNTDETSSSTSTSVVIISSDQATNFTTVEGGSTKAPGGPGGYGSSKILSTKPAINTQVMVGEEFTIEYTVPVIASTGRVNIFQSSGTNPILKQSIPSSEVTFENGTTIKFRTLDSTLSPFSVPYYATVDNDFVKEKSNQQNVIGIREKVWTFTTNSNTVVTGGESESVIIRLTTAGTSFYRELSKNDRISFAKTMSKDLTRALSVDQDRLSTTKNYQFDSHTSEDQAILRVDIKKAVSDQTSSEYLANNLDEIIRNKDYNGLADGKSASLLDASNGAPKTEKLWKKYWGFLLAALILLAILLLFFLYAHKKFKHGRNFLAIFLLALVPIDLALDIAFISLHGKDFKWVLPATIFFLLFPLILNFVFTTNIIKKEKSKHRTEFNKWWKNNRGIANTFKTASYLDTDGLLVLSSRTAGIEKLSAPFTEEGERAILFSSGIVVFFEDLPQFIIYVVYIAYHIKPAITPILVLSSCIAVIMLKLAAIFCSTCCFGRKRKHQDTEQTNIRHDSASITDSSDSENEKGPQSTPFSAPISEKPTTTHNVPPEQKPKDEDGGPTGDRNKSFGVPPIVTFGDKPVDKDNAKSIEPTQTSPVRAAKEEPTTTVMPDDKKAPTTPTTPTTPTKSKLGTLVGKFRKKKDDKDTPTTVLNVGSEKDSPSNRPNVSSVISESVMTEITNNENYLKTAGKEEKNIGDNVGTSNATIIGGFGGVHPYIVGGSTVVDKKRDVIIGASISGVTASGLEGIMYIIITISEEDGDELRIKKSVVKITITKESEERYITLTSNNVKYITIYTEGKYITKPAFSDEEYTTRSVNNEYTTTTNDGEEYITTISTTTTKETTTSTRPKSKVTTLTTEDDKQYVTRSKNETGGYIAITSLYEIDETRITEIYEEYGIIKTISSQTYINIETDEYGNETTIETTVTTDENGKTTTTIKTTKKDKSGKILDEKTETVDGARELPFNKDTQSTNIVGEETKTETTVENGIEITIVTVIATHEDGSTTSTITTTKKDSNGRILEENTEIISGTRELTTTDTSLVQIGEETKTETSVENGIETTIVTVIRTHEDGSKTTTITTTKKDSNGKILEENTETISGTRELTVGSTADTSLVQTGKEINTEITVENGIETTIVTEIETHEDGSKTTTITTTKKDSSGKVLETYTETSTSEGTCTASGVDRTIANKPARKQTKSFETVENGILTVVTTTQLTDDDGNITTTVETTKKDSAGNTIETETETYDNNLVEEPEEYTTSTAVSGTKTTESTSISRGPMRKQTKNFSFDENGLQIETETVSETEGGKTITRVTTIKKDKNGKVIESDTKSTESTEPIPATVTKKFGKSIIGPSIFEEHKEEIARKREERERQKQQNQ